MNIRKIRPYLLPISRACVAVAFVIGLTSCATLNSDIAKLQQVYTVATTTSVPPQTVIVAANAFDALKATAINYATYCIQGKFVDPICSAANRRKVVQFVRSGTTVRNQLEVSIATNTPAASTLYNILVAAVNGLNSSALANFNGAKQ
jgi:hypothetical protein